MTHHDRIRDLMTDNPRAIDAESRWRTPPA